MRTLPPLYVVCDAEVCDREGWPLDDYAAACLDGGATLLQIRAKRSPSRWLLDQATRIVERAVRYEAAVIVNDRADVARLSGAAGVHVGQDDLAPQLVRALVGPEALVGFSTHTEAQADAALDEPLSYIAVGPAFGTATKETGYTAVGVELIRRVSLRAAARALPVVAIGGITLERAADVMAAGATSVAVISDLLSTGDPRARVAAFVRLLSRV